MALQGRELLAASEALRDAFSPGEFAQLLRFYLDKRLENLAAPGNFQAVVYEVLDQAEREGWTSNLLAAAREANPTNPRLMALAEAWQLAPVRPETRDALERIISEEAGFLDITRWRERLGALEGQVGRVEVTVPDGVIKGTAFLVGPDVCITNYHVLERVIEGAVAPSQTVVRFDYKRSGDGVVLNDGTEHRVPDHDWLIDASPPSPVDSMVDPGDQLPAEDQLDYAVFRLTGEPGEESIGGPAAGPQAPKRGWIGSAATAEPFSAESTMFVLQHPKGEPLKLAFGPVSGLNGNSTRVHYRVNTEPGSSGSPCFNRNLELAAVHHGGDPDFAVGHLAQYNEAVPLSAICRLMTQRNVASSVFVAAGG
jgi:Trypsin-like peptidase domain/Effector-associated domain 1